MAGPDLLQPARAPPAGVLRGERSGTLGATRRFTTGSEASFGRRAGKPASLRFVQVSG